MSVSAQNWVGVKIRVRLDQVAETVLSLMKTIHDEMLARAAENVAANTRVAVTYEEF